MAARNLALIAALTTCAGCALHRGPLVPESGLSFDRTLSLNGHDVVVHVADLRIRPGAPLLIYATGDRGWAGKDLDVYRHLVSWGYPVAGFDAHDYVTHLGGGDGTTTPFGVASDYEAIATLARDTLQRPSGTPILLVGVSRGAGLSVVAAGQRRLRKDVQGVVVMGLTKEEEYVHWYGRLRRDRGSTAAVMLQVYEYLPQLGPLPVTVIQSTRDNYLPAASARALFGADSATRRLITIDARNHSFAGARDELYDALHGALASMAGTR